MADIVCSVRAARPSGAAERGLLCPTAPVIDRRGVPGFVIGRRDP